MVNWQDELKRYLAKKFEQVMGEEMPIENITTIEMNVDLDISLLSIEDLAQVYAFCVMKEDYEGAKRMSDELAKRNCEIKIEINEKTKTGIIDVYYKPITGLVHVNVPIKVYPDGLMIDWEKEDI